MLVATLSLWREVAVAVASLFAGISNGIAGGGTFITFPTLMAVGLPALTANVTSSVGVLPSYVGGLRGYRDSIATHLPLVRRVVPWCVAGTISGCALLLTGSSQTFRALVPWLIAAGTVLFAFSPLLTKRLAHLDHHHPARRVLLSTGLFAVGVYGGYFGAGLGILLLAVMAIALPLSVAELQGLRSVLSTVINAVAAFVFVCRGHVVYDAVIVMLIGTLIGGWIGTLLIQRLSPLWIRILIVATGILTVIRLATTP